MTYKTFILGTSLAVALFSILPMNSYAYQDYNHEPSFYADIYYAPGFLDINQNVEKPKEKSEYKFSPLNGGLGLVYKTKSNIRLELEGIFGIKNDVEFDFSSMGAEAEKKIDYSANMKYAGLIAGAYYDVYSSDFASGYVGGGMGMSYLGFDNCKRRGVDCMLILLWRLQCKARQALA